MTRLRIIFAMALLVGVAAAAIDRAAAADGAASDLAAIRALSDAFVKAFNEGSAEAIAAQFVPEAEVVDEEGVVIEGRDAIRRRFEEVFESEPEARISLSDQTFRVLGAETAIERGVSKVTGGEGGPEDDSPYTVIYAKKDGRWLTTLIEEHSSQPESVIGQVEKLGPLVGEWVSESDGSVVTLHYEWDESKTYLLGSFEVKIEGRPAMKGTERIGWDALSRRYRSWVFDSQGGFNEGFWVRVGKGEFLAKMTGVTDSGEAASASRRYTFQSKDRIAVSVSERTLGGEAIPGSIEFVISRQPPKPK